MQFFVDISFRIFSKSYPNHDRQADWLNAIISHCTELSPSKIANDCSHLKNFIASTKES